MSIKFNNNVLAEPERYRVAINPKKKDISYLLIEFKKLEEENIIL